MQNGADLSTPELVEDRIVISCARPGGGKTSVARARAAKWKRHFVIDQQVKDGRGEYPGWVCYSTAELAKALERFEDPAAPGNVVYRGPIVDGGARDPVNVAIFEVLEDLEDLLVTVEEADRLMESKWCPPGLYSIAHHGRRFGQCLTLNTRRPANISKDLTAVADAFYTWTVAEPGDRKYLKARGFPLDVLDGLKGHESLRRFFTEEGRPEFYLCRCDVAHSGRCGKPLEGYDVDLEELAREEETDEEVPEA